MSTFENLIENPDEWEDPMDEERKTRSYKAKIAVRLSWLTFCFNPRVVLQMRKYHLETRVIEIIISGKNAHLQ